MKANERIRSAVLVPTWASLAVVLARRQTIDGHTVVLLTADALSMQTAELRTAIHVLGSGSDGRGSGRRAGGLDC